MTNGSDMQQDKRREAWLRHDRRWRDHHYVYAVVSRRSRGISVGINLNPGKACNFDCVYCQVNRREPPVRRMVDLERLADELERVLEAERDGSIYESMPFSVLKGNERGVRDIAFSGDGEPTSFRRLGEAVRLAAAARRRHELDLARLVLITNAAFLDGPSVKSALAVLDENNGEIWAKLDAGTEEHFRRVNRAGIPLETILGNILDAARVRPVVVQTLWFRHDGSAPSGHELQEYCNRLKELVAAGARIKNIQLYTIARDPSEKCAVPLNDAELNAVAESVRARVDIPIEIFYGAPGGS